MRFHCRTRLLFALQHLLLLLSYLPDSIACPSIVVGFGSLVDLLHIYLSSLFVPCGLHIVFIVRGTSHGLLLDFCQ